MELERLEQQSGDLEDEDEDEDSSVSTTVEGLPPG